MAHAFIAVGSNIDPEANVRKAVRSLAAEIRIVGISTVYQTEPEGRPEQPPFYNLVIEIETNLSAHNLKYQLLRRVESNLGRRRTGDKYAPRKIDLDLIVYDDLVLETNDLNIPDPQILDRPFLAIPLSELCPEMILPGIGLSLKQVIARLKPSRMKPMSDFTALLKKEIGDGSQS